MIGGPSAQDVAYARNAIGARATRAQVARYLGCHETAVDIRILPRQGSAAARLDPAPPPRHERASTPRDLVLQIVDAVAAEAGLTREEVLSERRVRRFAKARWSVFWTLKTQHGFGPIRIARLFGLDHSSVIHGLRKHEAGRGGLRRRPDASRGRSVSSPGRSPGRGREGRPGGQGAERRG